MERVRYLSYLLRLWQSSEAEKTAWHASLDDPRTGERLGFPSLEALFGYLQEQIGNTRSTEDTLEGTQR